MIMEITRRYEFIAAHYLPFVPDGHRCKRMHGHNYEIEISVRGPMIQGWIMDFWDLDKIMDPLLFKVDHYCLNDITGLENPTAEVIATWFLAQVQQQVAADYTISSVKVFETKNCIATVYNVT